MAVTSPAVHLVVILLVFSQCECQPVWNNDKLTKLKDQWTKCQFPPEEAQSEEVIGVCKNNPIPEASRGITYICALYEAFATELCEVSTEEDLLDAAEYITEFIASHDTFYLCDDTAGIRIPDSVRNNLDETTCKITCSGQAAEKLCRLISIFSLTGYKSMKKAADSLTKPAQAKPTVKMKATLQAKEATTSTPKARAKTTVVGSKVTNPSKVKVKKTSAKPATVDKDNKTKETKHIKEKTAGDTTKKNTTKKGQATQSPTRSDGNGRPEAAATSGSITYGKLAIYGITGLLVCVGLYAVYRYRKALLACLQESPVPASDGKGGYKKVPSFEKILPDATDREKAKNYIY